MTKDVLILGLIGIVLTLIGAHGTYNGAVGWPAFVGLFGILTFCLAIKNQGANYRLVNSGSVERRKRRIRWPKHKERRKFAEASGISYRGNIQIRERKHFS